MRDDWTQDDWAEALAAPLDSPLQQEAYTRLANYLLGVAMRQVGNRQIAEEMVQVALFKFYEAYCAGKYRGEGKPTTYATRIMLNAAYTEFKRAKRLSPLEPVAADDPPDEQHPGEEAAEPASRAPRFLDQQLALRQDFVHCWQMLTEHRRRLFWAKVVKGHTSKELAARLNISEHSVNKAVRQASESLRMCLERRGGWGYRRFAAHGGSSGAAGC